jgi:hypothetical protein
VFSSFYYGFTIFSKWKRIKWKSLWKPAAVSLGVIIVLFVSKGIFDFSGPNDGYFTQSYGPDL